MVFEYKPLITKISRKAEIIQLTLLSWYATIQSHMLKIIVFGAQGKMGEATVNAINAAHDMSLVGTIDLGDDAASILHSTQPDVMIDFTHPDAVKSNITMALNHGVHAVVGTTGLNDEDRLFLDSLAKEKGKGVAICPNFALGVILMMKAAQDMAKHMDRVEIIEYHHDKKADAPSGTAIKTAELIAEAHPTVNAELLKETELLKGARGATHHNVPIHSLRLPGIIASQEVVFGSIGQTLSIRQDTFSRESFMPGVLLAIRHIINEKGLIYGLEHFID